MNAFRPHIERAIALHKTQVALAREVGCSQQYISWLLNEADQISAEMSVAFEKATNGDVSRQQLRPDLFGAPSDREPAAS